MLITPSKTFSRRHSFPDFPRKQVLLFHVMETICMKCQILHCFFYLTARLESNKIYNCCPWKQKKTHSRTKNILKNRSLCFIGTPHITALLFAGWIVLNSFGAEFQTTFIVYFFFFFFFFFFYYYFNKLSFGKTFICKFERLNVKQRRSSLSRLIWIYAVCKSLLLLPVAVKELMIPRKNRIKKNALWWSTKKLFSGPTWHFIPAAVASNKICKCWPWKQRKH